MNVKEFMLNYQKWGRIESDLTNIVMEYDDKITFYNPISIHPEVYDNKINLGLDTGSIPFELILKLNDYMGCDCSMITVTVGHHINLSWEFE